MGYWSQKAEDDLKNSDLFRECKLCYEFMEISKFDVKYRNYTSIGPLDYQYWECKECRRNKTNNAMKIFEHNMKYLDRISISWAYEGELMAHLSFEKTNNNEIGVTKYFYGKTLTELNEKITAFLNNEIKL